MLKNTINFSLNLTCWNIDASSIRECPIYKKVQCIYVCCSGVEVNLTNLTCWGYYQILNIGVSLSVCMCACPLFHLKAMKNKAINMQYKNKICVEDGR